MKSLRTRANQIPDPHHDKFSLLAHEYNAYPHLDMLYEITGISIPWETSAKSVRHTERRLRDRRAIVSKNERN